MDPSRDFGRMLLVFGGILIALGLVLTFGSKLPLRLGRLPGDIVYQGRDTTFYFPIVTCIVLSAGLSFLLWLISYLRR
jgi:hypothetical protein